MRLWGCGGLLVLVATLALAAPPETRFRRLPVGTENERLEFSASVPLRTASVCNLGAFAAYVDFDGTGVADPGKATSHEVDPGFCIEVRASVIGHEIRVVGAIAPDGDTVVHFHLGE